MKPKGWTVIGQGPLADAVRETIAADPDRYLPETWNTNSAGLCPCCGHHVYKAETRETNFEPGFLCHEEKRVHPVVEGGLGCCCVAPNWGPKHKKHKRERKRG